MGKGAEVVIHQFRWPLVEVWLREDSYSVALWPAMRVGRACFKNREKNTGKGLKLLTAGVKLACAEMVRLKGL